jgi:hypothetical protein
MASQAVPGAQWHGPPVGKAKAAVAANYQFASVDELAKRFIDWVKQLSPRRAKLLAGILSPQFWLKQLL